MGPTQKKIFAKAPFVAAGGLTATPAAAKLIIADIKLDVAADVLVTKTAKVAAAALAVSDAAAAAVVVAQGDGSTAPQIAALEAIASDKLALSTAAATAASDAVTAAGTTQAAIETPTAANTANMSLAELEAHAGVHSLVEGTDYDSNADLIELNFAPDLEAKAAATVPVTDDTIRPKQALVDAIRKAQLIAAINTAEGDA